MPDYNKDSCPLIEPASSVSTGSYMSSVPKSLMGKSSHAHATKSLQQIRSVSPGMCMYVCMYVYIISISSSVLMDGSRR